MTSTTGGRVSAPTTRHAQSPHRYVSGFCGTGQHDRCAGAYANTTCTCPHHTVREQLDEPLELCLMAPYATEASA